MGAEDGSNDEGKDGEHVKHGSGGDGSGVVVVVNASSVFMCKPCSLMGLAVQTRVCRMGDPMSLDTVLLLPLTGISFYMLQECPVHS